MKKSERVILTILYILVIICLVVYRKNIITFVIEHLIYSRNITEYTPNEYTRQENFEYVKTTDKFIAHSAKDVLNIVYTIIDSGASEFTFYCDKEYANCQNDIESLSSNTDYLTLMNNFVDPYNSYKKLYVVTNAVGKITISLDKLYSDEEINLVNAYIDNFEKNHITSDMTYKDKIKEFHDYVINNAKYDSLKANELKNNIYSENTNQSHKATGIVKNKLALCSGYTDIMAIYLDRLGIKNYKVSNDTHIWNALYIDDAWYHLDLTWDDPVTSNGKNLLIYEFFIIDTDKLIEKDTLEHTYNSYIYKEIATKD